MHMAGLQTALGSDSPGLTLFLNVVGLAIALVLLYWIFRKIAGTGKMGSSRHKQPRLAVSSATPLDGKRRLVLIRRDEVELVVMIGGSSDVLIENNIVSKRERTGGVRNKRQEPPVEKAEQPEYFPEEERAYSWAATIAGACIPANIHQNQVFAQALVVAAEAGACIVDVEYMHSLLDPGVSVAVCETF
jgi:flagellar biogenesis protein FliO